MTTTIDWANRRGIGDFHVFTDVPNYINGEWVGHQQYHSTWHGLETAKAVAARHTNGTVYNANGKRVY